MSLSADTRRNLLLSLFGTLLGCVFAFGAYIFYVNRLKPGQEFESLDDLRRQMLAVDSEKKSGRVDLRDIMNPHPSDTMIYDLRPSLDVIFQGVPTRTNSCGLRYREVPQSKGPDTFRIAMLGDSFAFGWGVRIEKSFGQVLEDNLNRIAAGARTFEVLNFGIPGYSTFQEVARFEELALDFEPDAVLVYVVENDFGLPFYVRDIENPGRIMPSTIFSRLSWSKSDPRVQEQLDRQRQFGAPRSLLRLAELCRERAIPLFLAINPRSRWEQDAKRLGKVRKQPGVKVINMWDDFLRGIRVRNLPDSVLALPNDPHPSEVKHGVLGEVLTPHFMQFASPPQ